MIDTGNMLKDPISQKPVAIVESSLIRQILPSSIIDNIQKILEGEILDLGVEVNEYMSIFKLIPFSSIGKEHRVNISIQTRWSIYKLWGTNKKSK